MQQQLNTAQSSESITTHVTVMNGVYSMIISINHASSHIHTPPLSSIHFRKHIIARYDKNECAMLYVNNHFKLEIDFALLKTSGPNAPFSLIVLQHNNITPKESQR